MGYIKREENGTTTTVVLKYYAISSWLRWPILLMALIIVMNFFMFQIHFTVFYFIFAVFFITQFVFAIPYYSTHFEVRAAMKQYPVTISGSKYSLKNPITYSWDTGMSKEVDLHGKEEGTREIEEKSKPTNNSTSRVGMGIIAFISGLLSFLLSWIYCVVFTVGQIICVVFGIVAIILSVIAIKKNPEKNGLAVTGLILGILGTVFGLFFLILCTTIFPVPENSWGGIGK